jgi:hypothetical protein
MNHERFAAFRYDLCEQYRAIYISRLSSASPNKTSNPKLNIKNARESQKLREDQAHEHLPLMLRQGMGRVRRTPLMTGMLCDKNRIRRLQL